MVEFDDSGRERLRFRGYCATRLSFYYLFGDLVSLAPAAGKALLYHLLVDPEASPSAHLSPGAQWSLAVLSVQQHCPDKACSHIISRQLLQLIV